jgi:hypothetical protein
MKTDGEYDAEYAVQGSAGSVDPQWTWYFNLPSTWLATVLALNPPSGSLTATTNTTGSSLPANGYTITVDGTSSQPIGINGSVTFSNLSAGSHNIVLSGVAANCMVGGGNSQTVMVPSGGTVTASFAVSCSAMVTTGEITGGGKLGSGRDFATFGFEAESSGGKVQWVQHCVDGVRPGSSTCMYGDFTFHGTTTPSSYSTATGYPNCRTWSGTGTVEVKNDASKSGTYAFTVSAACDNGEPGHDTDSVDVTIAGYHNSGYLNGGNVELHKPD